MLQSSGAIHSRLLRASERSPRPCSTVTGQHGQGYDELQHPEQRLIQHIPGRSVRGEHPAQGQHGRYYAKRPEKEGHKDQPERPAPASDHAYAEQGEERRDRYEEEEPRLGGGEPQGAAVDFRRRSEERHQARPSQDEKAEHQRLGSVDSHIIPFGVWYSGTP